MTARTTRRTRLIAAVSATAGALALTLLPTTAAYAVTPAAPAFFSYIDANTLALSAGAADGSGSTSLVSAGYRAYAIDATPNGATSVVSLCNGSLAACNDNPPGSVFDGTFGVLLLHDEGANVVSSRLLTNLTSTNAAISADGSKVVWAYRDVLGLTDTLYVYDTASETASAVSLGTITKTSPAPVHVAVSDDGANAAVLYRKQLAGDADKVIAFPVATGPATLSYFAKSYPASSPVRPSSSLFSFVDATNVVYDEFDSSTPASVTPTRTAVRGTLSPGNTTATVVGAVPLPALQDYYQLRKDLAGNWWAWKDTDSAGVSSLTDATVSAIDNPLASSPIITRVSTRTDSAHTYGYVPSDVAPPKLDVAVTTTGNAALSHPTFKFSAVTVLYNGKSAYQTYNLYGGLPNGAYDTRSGRSAETDRGFLQQSFDGITWTKPGLQTSGAKAFVLGTQFYNGYMTSLRRNTYYRWTWDGDAFTTGFTTSLRKVTVIPIVSATSKAFGTKRIVSGAATRPTGTVYLYRKVGTKYVYVTSTRIVKTATYAGKYAFAARALSRGTYKVVTVADTYMGSGSKVFAV